MREGAWNGGAHVTSSGAPAADIKSPVAIPLGANQVVWLVFNVNSALLILVMVGCSSTVSADNSPQRTFSKIRSQTQNAKTAKLLITSAVPNGSYVTSSDDPAEGCMVYIHSDLPRALRNELLAVLMAHEIAHCELGHHAQAREPVAADKALQHSWELEYQADAMIVKLTQRLEMDARAAFSELMSIFPDGPGHPSGQARIQALRGGERMAPPITSASTANNSIP